MNHLLDDDDQLSGRREREVNLSTAAILGIFFGLVLLCGLFFGLGYSMGSHKPSATVADSDTTPSGPATNFNSFKPAAGSPVASSGVQPPAGSPIAGSAYVPPTGHASSATPASAAPASTPDEDNPAPAPVVRSPSLTLSHPTAPAPSAPATGSFLVQVAAVSHEEDATLLVGALKSKGYAVAARTEPQDKLFHIQVGPFSNRKDADTMRQRLLADGYNALIK